MNTWQAFFLGLVQGITEFLPVSSSGHLALGQYILGFEDLKHYILFNMICHLGTLGAIFAVLFFAVKEKIKKDPVLLLQVCLGTIPLFPLLLILKPLKELFNDPNLLGPCFIATSLLLFASVYCRFPLDSSPSQRTWKDPFTIGLFQAIAIFPGISRSGATISAARLLSWPKEEAIQFSFLLAIPAILGGTVLEAWQVWKGSASASGDLHLSVYIIGFSTSFFMGCLALKFLIRMMIHDQWKYFAWYCLLLGMATIVYFNVLRPL